MLKRKLKRAGNFAQGLLIIAAVDKIHFQPAQPQHPQLYSYSDTSIVLGDSAMEISDDALVDLPAIELNKFAKAYYNSYLKKKTNSHLVRCSKKVKAISRLLKRFYRQKICLFN